MSEPITPKLSTNTSFDYDVATSFLQQDENVARQLNDALRDRFQNFIWYEQQKILAGAEGASVFVEVFRKRANVVVILYRPEWGSSQWTAVERRAIEDRHLDEGDEFCFVIAMDLENPRPPFISRYRIWLDLNSFGIEGAVAAIAHKLTERGAERREESLAERAARARRDVEHQQKRDRFLDTTDSREAAERETLALMEAFEEQVSILGEHAGLNLTVTSSSSGHLLVMSRQVSLSARWRNPQGLPGYRGAWLEVEFWAGLPLASGRMAEPPPLLFTRTFRIDIDRDDQIFWSRHRNRESRLSVAQLAAECLREILRLFSSRSR